MNNSTLASELGMEFHTLSKRLKVMELPHKSNEILQEGQLKSVLGVYSTPHSRRPQQVVLNAEKLLQSGNLSQTNINITNNYRKPAKKRVPKTEVIEEDIKYKNWVFAVFLMVIAYQVEHTTVLAMMLAKTDSLWVNFPLALLAGLAIQLTAFLITINNGSDWILQAYGVGEFSLSMIYFAPWSMEGESIVIIWAASILISLGAAFSIYSYSDLLTSKKM